MTSDLRYLWKGYVVLSLFTKNIIYIMYNMIVRSYSNIDIIQGRNKYGDATEGITDWRLENTTEGVLNILNSSSTTANISIIDNGNVGIGTIPISSSSKLEVFGDINSTGIYRKIIGILLVILVITF